MALSFDFRQNMFTDWEKARGYLVEQFDRLYASLGPIGPLLDGLAATTATAGTAVNSTGTYTTSAVLTTNTSGTPSFTPTLPMPLAFVTSATFTAPVLTANTNDWNPTNLSSAAIVRLATTGVINVTGMQAASGLSTFKLLVNAGTNAVTLTHADGSSAAGNRWRCPGAANFTWSVSRAIWVWYDTTSAVWQVVG